MKLLVAEDYAGLCDAAAEFVIRVVREKPSSLMIVATGATPMGLYERLVSARTGGTFQASRLTVFQLDEYCGISDDDRRSLYGWMRRSFLDPLGIPDENVVRLRCSAEACRTYEAEARKRGGIDLAVLGLGPNGHLGFNEPPSQSDVPTRIVRLSPQSIESNAAYWGSVEAVPSEAVTAGMNILLTARRIALLVSGAHKRSILRRVIQGPPEPDVPASFLRDLPNVTVFADRGALGADATLPGR